MAAEERNIDYTISSDATFRTWGSETSDLWQDNALTKTADTGQIDWATVTRPAANTDAGYEIFTLTTDTEQANFGLYIRVDYGCGNLTSTPRLAIQVGSGTNGAGTLTGKVGTKRQFTTGTATSASAPNYCSGGDGRFAFAGNWTAGTTSAGLRNTIIIIERLRDNTGAVTDDGIYTFLAGSFSTSALEYWSYSQIIRPDDSGTPIASLNKFGSYLMNASGSFGGDLYLSTHNPADRQLYNPIIGNLFYYHTDLTAGSNISVDMYGSTRTYKPIGRNMAGTSGFPNSHYGHTNSGFLILFE